MSEDDLGPKMAQAFGTVRRIFEETSLLLQTVDDLMGPEFRCPFGNRGVWGMSSDYTRGANWLAQSVSRFWEKREDPLRAVLVSIDFDPEGPWSNREEDVGPVVTAMSIKLQERVKKNGWSFWWRDRCARDRGPFKIVDADAPIYHSVLREEVDLDNADKLESIDNFWLPLCKLTDEEELRSALVSPLKKLAFDGTEAADLSDPSLYLRVSADDRVDQ